MKRGYETQKEKVKENEGDSEKECAYDGQSHHRIAAAFAAAPGISGVVIRAYSAYVTPTYLARQPSRGINIIGHSERKLCLCQLPLSCVDLARSE